MGGRKSFLIAVLVTGFFFMQPLSGFAQVISGVVTDPSDAVLPGVTVEASSPALIEQTRTVITNEVGRYSIVNLLPGTYTVTFSLPGFATVKRDGIVLTSGFTAPVNIKLQVGNVSNTVEIQAAAPVVDVEGIATPKVMTREVMDELPGDRSPLDLVGKLPGGGAGAFGAISYRGTTDSLTKLDGIRVTNLIGAGPSLSMAGGGFTNEMYQEYSFTTGAESTEMGQPGVLINLVPREGGNDFHGSAFVLLSNDSFTTSNITPALRALNFGDPAKQLSFWDVNPSFGGPIKKDKLWFFATGRYNGSDFQRFGSYANKSPVFYKFDPDTTKPGHSDTWARSWGGRLTWQATSKDKVTGFVDSSYSETPHFLSPIVCFLNCPNEVTLVLNSPDTRNQGVKWSRTQSARFLTEFSFSRYRAGIVNDYPAFDKEWSAQYRSGNPPTYPPKVYSMLERTTNIPFGAANVSDGNISKTITINGSESYVNGTHNLKVGFTFLRGSYHRPNVRAGDVQLQFFNSAPSLAAVSLPQDRQENVDGDLAIYAQERWTIRRRLTLNLGLRFDSLRTSTPDQCRPASIFLTGQCFNRADALNWKDLSPRVGGSYDLFGNGKTAVKASLARYVAGETVNLTGAQNPANRVATTTNYTWTDSNGDFTIFNPDGTLQTAELSNSSNANFGLTIPTTQYDPKVLRGWGKRGYTWEYDFGVQHELVSGLALNAGFYRRWDGNQTITDNLALTNADYTGPFCVSEPTDSRLGDFSGKQVCGLYDITAAARARPGTSYVTFAKNIGTHQGITSVTRGFEINLNGRFQKNLFVTGGVDIRGRVTDNCDTFIDSPEKLYCHQSLPYRMDWKLNGSYTFPLAFRVSTAYSVVNGYPVNSTWVAPNAVIAPALGRDLSAGATQTKSIPLIEPNVQFGPYRHNFDVRVSRVFKREKRSITANLDLYNTFNRSQVTAVNTTYSTVGTNGWLVPSTINSPRLIRLGAQVQF
jgi:Carboxypeptidase regulatory-like domain